MTALAALQVDSPLSYLAFEDKPWAGLLLAFGTSITISALIEVIRRWGRRSAARAAAHSCVSPPHDGASRAPVP